MELTVDFACHWWVFVWWVRGRRITKWINEIWVSKTIKWIPNVELLFLWPYRAGKRSVRDRMASNRNPVFDLIRANIGLNVNDCNANSDRIKRGTFILMNLILPGLLFAHCSMFMRKLPTQTQCLNFNSKAWSKPFPNVLGRKSSAVLFSVLAIAKHCSLLELCFFFLLAAWVSDMERSKKIKI